MSKRTKFLLGIGVIAALVIGWQVAAFAVHADAFELDGNGTDETSGTNDPNNTLDDWINVCNQRNDPALQCDTVPPPDGATARTTAPEPTADETAFLYEPANTTAGKATSVFTGGGSKDELTPQGNWQFKSDGGLPDKDNLVHSYAALYQDEDLLYFGADRYDNSGDAALGFWFFKAPVAQSPPPPATDGGFTGNHTNGDLLVISDFTNGGQVSDIFAYLWDDTCGGTNGDPIVSNPEEGDCGGNNLRLELAAHNATCVPPGTNPPPVEDDACAIVNQSTTTLPWTFDDKTTRGAGAGANTALKSEFFEGGVDLGALGLADACFTTAMAETRSSTSTDAVLKDFTIGPFGSCGSKVTTQQSVNGGTTPIEADGTNSVSDSATVEVSGANDWSGTVQFSLTGPGATATPVNIGAPVPVSDETPTVNSIAATVTSAGDYCWSAHFDSATAGVPDGDDDGTNECFTVTPRTPTLTTTAGADVTLGQPITDTATLTGTANQPGTPVINPTTAGGKADGTITFTLFGPSDTGCGPQVQENGQNLTRTETVSGDGTYGPVSFTPTAPGTYHWVASYDGDLPNTNGVTHNADCTNTDEDVVVTSVKSSMTSAQSFIPNDSATISAPQGGNLAGTVTFKAYESSDCSGTAILTQNVAVSGASPQTVGTDNTTVKTTAANISWNVSYDSTNPAQQDIPESPATCFEKTALNIDNGGTVSSP